MTTQKEPPPRSPLSHLAQNLLLQNTIRIIIRGIFYAYCFVSFKTACVAVHILDDFIKNKYFIVKKGLIRNEH